MKLVIDDKIPYIRKAAAQIADRVIYAPGNAFTPQLVHDADALIIRTRTHCNRELLEGSRVRFIATATIGFDHIDANYCQEAGIVWQNAPGCNANSVAQYIQSALFIIQFHRRQSLKGMTMGIIGAGNVGSRVAQVAERLGVRVLLNDPPREEKEKSGLFVPLQQLAAECDILSFHVPLEREGKYATFHQADDRFFRSLRRKPIIINTSRGEVVDTSALLTALEEGTVSDAIIDVWEQEPDINRELLGKTLIGTPHIAGYSADGKANATRMALDAVCKFFGIEAHYNIVPPMPANPVIHAHSYEDAVLQIYNPSKDSQFLKEHPEQFETFRGNYPLRREETGYEIFIE